MALNFKSVTKSDIAIICAAAMLVGFLTSRVLLSAATVAFGVNALIGTKPSDWFKNKWWVVGLIWVGIYVISGLWSNNIPQWSERVSVKLPIVILPLAFAMLPRFSVRQLRFFTISCAIIFFCSMLYSLSFLLADPAYYIDQYRVSKVLPTPAEHDYIRYSLSIALFIVWCIYILKYFKKSAVKWFIRVTIILLSLYIHVIAVKTGILVLYLFVFMYALYYTFSRKPFTGLIILALIILSPVVAYKYIPTFEQKIDYFEYSWKVFGEGRYDSDYSDIGRLVSYDIALKLLPDYWVAGTGMGDMHDVMRTGYQKWHPNVPEYQQLKPHNQFLIVALGCGIPALFVFIFWIFYPLKWVRKSRDGFFMFAFWVLMFVPLMVEPFLELQFGIYLYLFYILLMAHSVRNFDESHKAV